MNEIKYTGIGKRKTAVAKLTVKEGSGVILINKKSIENFFSGLAEEKELIKTPFALLNLTNKYDVAVQVKGGGINGQLDAIKLALSKALCKIQNEYRPILNKSLLLRRDSRIKEIKKYGLKKARKGSQYSKR